MTRINLAKEDTAVVVRANGDVEHWSSTPEEAELLPKQAALAAVSVFLWDKDWITTQIAELEAAP